MGVVPTQSIQGDCLRCQGREAGLNLSSGVARNFRRPLSRMLSELERTAFLNSRVLGRERRHEPALKAFSASRIVQR